MGDEYVRVTLALEWAKPNWFEVSILSLLIAYTCYNGCNKMCDLELQHPPGKGLA